MLLCFELGNTHLEVLRGSHVQKKKAKVFIHPLFTLLAGDLDLAVVVGEARRTGVTVTARVWDMTHVECFQM